MINASDMALKLGVKKETVEDWARNSKIPAFKIGHSWRFEESEVFTALKLSGNDLSRAIGRVSATLAR
jgi:excisionase family DNA binding protein